MYLCIRNPIVYKDILVCVKMGSNRTFMELKYYAMDMFGRIPICSNRTFMELKYVMGSLNSFQTGIVLIVPLWN